MENAKVVLDGELVGGFEQINVHPNHQAVGN